MDNKMYFGGDDIGGLYDNNPVFVRKFILSKILSYQDILNKTYLSLQKQMTLKIIQQNDINSCIEELNSINNNIKDLLTEANDSQNIDDELLAKLQLFIYYFKTIWYKKYR